MAGSQTSFPLKISYAFFSYVPRMCASLKSWAYILFWFSMRNGEDLISSRKQSPRFIERVKD